MPHPPLRLTALACATAAALVVSLALPVAASAAPPSTATLVGPSDGGTTASVTPTLSVAADDPDGGSLDVTFEGRERGATVAGDSDADPFTLVVIPDTQNYSYANQAILDTQLEWVRDSVDELDTAFVIQVGDLVSEWDIPRHWDSISGAFEILDNAAVPYTVLPGNHDFDTATGDMGVFNSHFPPSRFSGATWNTAETRYGGYLGQDQFGPDAIDRGNADSYALFSAGGTDFLLLNLEWEAPGYALDWADRVIDAHPDRTVIMATHSFLTINGLRMTTPQRAGGTSTAALWEEFVSTHCQIRLVLSGHSNSGDLGEAHRTDDNACGQPVQQILTDYQSRANGGDGWLRSYRFDPAASTMTATTYSPSLDRYETDADSAFTLPFELAAPEPAPFTAITTRTVPAGATASAPWSGLDHDTEYEWRAVVDDGTASTTSATWRLRTPPVPQTILAADAFGRTVANGWGNADVGGAWTASGGSSTPFAVSAGSGVMTLMPGQTRVATLGSVVTDDAVIDVQLGADVASASGAAHATILGRSVGSSSYGLNVRFEPGGVLRLYLLRNGSTALDTRVSAWQPGQSLTARLSVTGTSPTQLAASVWPTGDPPPSGWQLAATDATSALQSVGALAIKTSVSSSSSVPTTRLTFDDFRAVTSTVEPPTNTPPTARFAVVASELSVSADASGSSDTDGTIDSYAWRFGDGSIASGAIAEHTYASAGAYTVTLTVTDDDGATDVTSRSVTVSADPPPAPNEAPNAVIAAPVVSGRAVTVSGAGSTDADGTVVSYAWQFGDGGGSTGATADHAYAADGTYTITLTITDDDGATATASRQVTVAAEPTQDDVIAADTFQRAVGSGWGTADVGGAWTVSGSSTPLSVADGTGRMTLIPGQTRSATLGSVSTADAVVEVHVRPESAAAGGAAHTTVIGRQVGNAHYGLNVRFEAGGQLRIYLLRDNTALAVRTGSWTPGQAFAARLSVTGASPTALAASVWSLSAPEPSGWQMTAADGAAGLQTAGAVAIKSSVSSSSSVASTRFAFDDLRVTSSTTAPPPPPQPNHAPTAIIATPTIDGRTIAVSGAGSTDSDGTLAAYAWQFGDGTVGTGPTAQHTYASDGAYTITLTVTDDDGAAATATRSVTVAAPSEPPADDVLAADAFGRTVANGWGSADVGGAWTASGGSSTPFSVGGGTGIMTLIPGQTRLATLGSVTTDDTVIEVGLSSDAASAGGAAHATIIGRTVGSSSYGLNVRFEPGGVLRLYLLRNNIALDTRTATWSPGQSLTARLSITGTAPTQLTASIWPTAEPAPSAWQLAATDTTPALQTPGALAIKGSVSSSSTVATTRLLFDDFVATTSG